MFGDNLRSYSVFLDYDPAADDDIPLWRVPQAATIKAAYVVNTNALAASSANYYTLALYNGGSAGTALGVIAGTLGGTAAGGTAPGWAALTPTSFTITNGSVAAGDVVVMRYDETGTGTFTSAFIQIDYVLGIG